MYDYIKGKLVEITPAYAVVDCGGIGYYINISVNTYSQLSSGREEVLLYVHQIVREDALLLYGFYSREERSLFRSLISVSGIGANTANVMLSSLSVDEIVGAILTENVSVIKSIKGIGIKTAQRVIIELKDKVGKENASLEAISFTASAVKDEAIAALIALGFSKSVVMKVVDHILMKNQQVTVEELIKLALKQM